MSALAACSCIQDKESAFLAFEPDKAHLRLKFEFVRQLVAVDELVEFGQHLRKINFEIKNTEKIRGIYHDDLESLGLNQQLDVNFPQSNLSTIRLFLSFERSRNR